MQNVYPVFLTKTSDNKILVEVPDFSILTEGTTMNDAIAMARDAIELKCVSMEDENEVLPLPSEISALNVEDAVFADEGSTVISYVDVDSGLYRRKNDLKTVRRNVALPSWLNYEAEKAGINVSRVLQDALMKVLKLKKRI